jgi:hypothetical protein
MLSKSSQFLDKRRDVGLALGGDWSDGQDEEAEGKASSFHETRAPEKQSTRRLLARVLTGSHQIPAAEHVMLTAGFANEQLAAFVVRPAGRKREPTFGASVHVAKHASTSSQRTMKLSCRGRLQHLRVSRNRDGGPGQLQLLVSRPI